jgi:eukaryotic-like serine/threonine-protein kinase
MKKTQRDRSPKDEADRLPATERGHGTVPDNGSSPVLGASAETVDLPSGAQTELNTDHIGIPPLPLDATRSLDASLPDLDTEAATGAFLTGDATYDGPLPGGGSEGASFLLNSNLVNSQATLPPGAEEPESKVPRVAGYEILGILGEGGMGIVYKAKHARLDRFVALKMIRAGAGARPQDLERFEAEAKAVAAIEHPNIVRIFEIGEHGGMPYCSLEYLPGGTLSRKIAGKPLPAREAARIGELLARAMAVVHKTGIIHRDLKPANVLLAADETPKITDFGLVKRLEDDSSHTRTGSILGTPSYMSPEQARGETHRIGPAADQYALGAILYELLTGRPPFQGVSVLDTLDQVRKSEPVPPSQLQPKMPRDLETICLKCLQKDVARRYPDVAALAEDLHRFQSGQPIVARPVSAAERAWRWCLRNPTVAVLSASVAASLMAGLITVLYSYMILSRKNVELRAATKLAQDKKTEAEIKEQRATKAAHAATEQNRSTVEAQVEMIALLSSKLKHVPNIEGTRIEFLDKATKGLEASAKAMTDIRQDVGWNPADEEANWRQLARACQALGQQNLELNRIEDAMKQFGRMAEIIEQLASVTPNDPWARVRLGRTKRQLGNIAHEKLGDSARAIKYINEAIKIDEECVEKWPDVEPIKRDLANSLGQLAGIEMALGHLDKAREIYDREEDVRESFSSGLRNSSESRRELAGLYEKLAELCLRMTQKDEGRQYYDRSAALRDGVLAEQPDFWPAIYDRARSYNNAAVLYFPKGDDPASARALHQKALELIDKRAQADPENFETKKVLAETLYYVATTALYSGDNKASADGYERCLKLRLELASEPKAKMSQIDVMLALARCGKHAEAAKIAEMLVATPPRDEELYFFSACGYALAAGTAGNAALARQYVGKAVECLRKGKERGWADVASLETDPDLAPIRNDPAFQALLAEFPRPRPQ